MTPAALQNLCTGFFILAWWLLSLVSCVFQSVNDDSSPHCILMYDNFFSSFQESFVKWK